MADLAPLEELAARQGASQPAWLAGISMHYARLERHDAARALFGDLADGRLADLSRDAVWVNAVTHLAEAAALLHDELRAATVYDLLVPYWDRMAVMDRAVVCKGAVSYYLGMLATTMRRWEQAAGHFDAALAQHRRIGSRPLVALTALEYARMLAARGRAGDSAAAAELACHALTEAKELGMAGLNSQARNVLAESECPPSRRSQPSA
jgi:hypothetical protein